MTFHFEDFKIGENKEDIHLDTRGENLAATRSLAAQAKRSMHIFSYRLDPSLYDDAVFLDAVKQLAIRSRYSKIQILVVDTMPLVKNGHRIIETARRVSSTVQLRKVHEDFSKMSNAYFVVDETALITRKVATRYEAILNFSNSKEARSLVKTFNEIWRRSSPEPMIRHLKI